MDSYMGIISLRLLLRDLNINSQELPNRATLRKARLLKADIKRTKETVLLFDLLELIQNCNEKETIYDVILEDDFLDWFLDSIRLAYTMGNSMEYIKWAISILTCGTDGSNKFSSRLCNNPVFLEIIIALSKDDSFSEAILIHLIFTIANITFNFQSTTFRNDEIKAFLLRSVNNDWGAIAMATLVALLPDDEVGEHEDAICSMIRVMVREFLDSFRSCGRKSRYSRLEENLAMIKAFCRCQGARSRLSRNFTLLTSLRQILAKDDFREYVTAARALMKAMYTAEQIKHIEENVASDARI